jgi:primosomal protein N'
LQSSAYHPLGWDDTEAFLKATIQTIAPTLGVYLESTPTDKSTTTPRLFRSSVLILRKRTTGIATVVDKIVENIDQSTVFPASLALITGTEKEWEGAGLISSEHDDEGSEQNISNQILSDDDILLSKAANEEQKKIIRALEKSGSVVVQGPPGTGKTHTIGNLVGHLLSQGKTILITAQTVKALRVVHDKIPEKLQPLHKSIIRLCRMGASMMRGEYCELLTR